MTEPAPSRVVTVTPNPSLDHTVEVPVLQVGEVQRTSQALVEAGGKGVNVARVLAKHGHRTTAILPAGDDAQRMVGLLTPQQVSTKTVRDRRCDPDQHRGRREGRHHHQAQRAGCPPVAGRRRRAAGCGRRRTRCRSDARLAGRRRQPAGRRSRRLLRPGHQGRGGRRGSGGDRHLGAGAGRRGRRRRDGDQAQPGRAPGIGDRRAGDRRRRRRRRPPAPRPRHQGTAGQPGRARCPADHRRRFLVGGRPAARAQEHGRRRRLHACPATCMPPAVRPTGWPGPSRGAAPPACCPAARCPARKKPKNVPAQSASSPIPIPSNQ